MGKALGVVGVLALVVLVALGLRSTPSVAPATDATGIAPAAQQVAPQPAAPVASGIQPDERWVARVAAATGIPVPAVRAYGRASLQIAAEQPSCHLGWTTLAGIGRVESGHGTFGGRRLLADGRSSAPITGPDLDGSSYAAIREGSDWAQAMGPLQFIPSTWRQWGADGDGDGTADVNDIDDASLAAARYLCADDHDLATGSGWNAAVLSYNHSAAYVRLVLVTANRYDRLSLGR